MTQQGTDAIFNKIFDASHIGSGRHFVPGFFHGKPRGLWGALKRIRSPEYGSVGKNLSFDDLKKFHGIISTRLKAKPDHVRGDLLTHHDRRAMYKELGALIKKSELSRTDLKDFKEIVHAINQTHKPARETQNEQPTILHETVAPPPSTAVNKPALVELASDRLMLRKQKNAQADNQPIVSPPPAHRELSSTNKKMAMLHPVTPEDSNLTDNKNNSSSAKWQQYRDL